MFTANIVPGYGFQEVEIYIKRHGKTASGRVTEVGYQPAEQAFLGIAAKSTRKRRMAAKSAPYNTYSCTIWSNGKSKGYRLSCVPRRT